MSRIIHEKDPTAFNLAVAAAIKVMPEFAVPEWATLVKSGMAKQRVPEDPDFWYRRAASILRQLYIQGVVGVSRLRTRYGSRKNRGVRPAKFKKASGKIIRTILKQAESAQLVEKIAKLQFGRRLTKKGREFLDSIASGIKFETTDAMASMTTKVTKSAEIVQEVAQDIATEENEEDNNADKTNSGESEESN